MLHFCDKTGQINNFEEKKKNTCQEKFVKMLRRMHSAMEFGPESGVLLLLRGTMSIIPYA